MDIKTYIETESDSVGASDPYALRRRLVMLGRFTSEVDDVLLETIAAARAAGVTWVDIATDANLGENGQAAQMWVGRRVERERLDEPDTTDGLSQKEAAARFGVSIPTFKDHLTKPDSEVARRVTVIEGVYRGRRVPRYVIAPE